MKTLREIRAGAAARELAIAAMCESPDKRALRRVSRSISASERLLADYGSMRSAKPLAPSRMRRLIGLKPLTALPT